VQVKGDPSDPVFNLKFSSFFQKSYYSLERHEMLSLAEALISAAETFETNK